MQAIRRSLFGENPESCALDDDARDCAPAAARSLRSSRSRRKPLGKPLRHGTTEGSPRSVAFNVQGFRVAVNKVTGEIRILKSVHAADAGNVANPMQCRGQIEGGVAQSIGATLYEEMVIDEDGRITNAEIPRLIICRSSQTFRVPRYISPTRRIRSARWARNR